LAWASSGRAASEADPDINGNGNGNVRCAPSCVLHCRRAVHGLPSQRVAGKQAPRISLLLPRSLSPRSRDRFPRAVEMVAALPRTKDPGLEGNRTARRAYCTSPIRRMLHILFHSNHVETRVTVGKRRLDFEVEAEAELVRACPRSVEKRRWIWTRQLAQQGDDTGRQKECRCAVG